MAPPSLHGLGKALTSAALALPGIAASLPALAQTAPPERLTVGMKYLYYQDYADGEELMGISAPYAYMEAPLGESWGIEASLLLDSIAGATPMAGAEAAPAGSTDSNSGASGGGPTRNALSSLERLAADALSSDAGGNNLADVTDERAAVDAKATYYFANGAAGLGMAYSTETDWVSRAVSADVRLATPDNNRTYAFGVGFTADEIRSNADPSLKEDRATFEAMIGVTQVLSQTQLLQSNLTFTYGDGFYDDVYRTGDVRPEERLSAAWLTRYRHYVPAYDAALHLDYRLFADDWGMIGHTFEVAWYQPVGDTWMVRPFLRYHSQNEADFYSPSDAPYGWGGLYSNDPRVGSFGALAPGLVIEKSFEDDWTLQLHAEYYERNADWHLTGGGSDGLEGLEAFVVIVGVRKSF